MYDSLARALCLSSLRFEPFMKKSFKSTRAYQKVLCLLVVIPFFAADAGLHLRPLRAQSADSWRAYNCQSCLRNLKSCRATLDNMKSSTTRTYTAESGMEVTCMKMETQCQQVCAGL
jgi:hypothetical protein